MPILTFRVCEIFTHLSTFFLFIIVKFPFSDFITNGAELVILLNL
jgi:hypothetical protein